jgi:hypothetical protein
LDAESRSGRAAAPLTRRNGNDQFSPLTGVKAGYPAG